jgi:DNA-binding CsgD family transcriptional regulator
MCGCGEKTPIAKQSHAKSGWLKGKPMRYLSGHQVRGPRPYRCKLSAEQEIEVCHQYITGATTYDLGEKYGASNTTIGNILEKHAVARRSPAEVYEARWPLSENQENETCRRYKAGETAKSIAQELGVSEATILKALDRHSVPRNFRGVYESAKRPTLRVLSETEEVEVCRRYEAGESGPVIAKALGIGEKTVDNVLKRGGVIRRPAVASERLYPEAEADVCRRYLAGEMPKTISAETGVGLSTISFVLKRNGIQPQHKIRYTPEQESQAFERYLAGDKIADISRVLGLSPGGVYQILRRRGADPLRTPRRLTWEEAEAAKVIRGLPAYRTWRLAVLGRDGRACQDCGAHSTIENPLHVHHLQAFAEILAEYRPISAEQAESYDALWDLDNGITLCADCHRSAHAKEHSPGPIRE